MTQRIDASEFDARVRRALLEENTGLRTWRRSRIEWRLLAGMIDAVTGRAA